jgi:hypothetical protein
LVTIGIRTLKLSLMLLLLLLLLLFLTLWLFRICCSLPAVATAGGG